MRVRRARGALIKYGAPAWRAEARESRTEPHSGTGRPDADRRASAHTTRARRSTSVPRVRSPVPSAHQRRRKANAKRTTAEVSLNGVQTVSVRIASWVTRRSQRRAAHVRISRSFHAVQSCAHPTRQTLTLARTHIDHCAVRLGMHLWVAARQRRRPHDTLLCVRYNQALTSSTTRMDV